MPAKFNPTETELLDTPPSLGRERAQLVDLLRGLVIVLMVLDHVRDYFHSDAFAFDPTDPSRTTGLLFLVRWVTHLCAPTFVFLAGASVALQMAGGKKGGELSGFLLIRGLWLIALELTVISFGFNFALPFAFVQVIWAIGAGLVAMAVLVHLPRQLVLGLGILIIAGHELLAPIDAAGSGIGATLWRLVMEPGPAGIMPGMILYPALPWLGILCLGYGLGGLFLLSTERQKRDLASLGAALLLAFVVLRLANGYGDPRQWSADDGAGRDVMSFLNLSKYPPSLAFVLATLGVTFSLAPLLLRLRGIAASVLLAFGRTPLFTYIVHIYVVHSSALLLGLAMGFPPSIFINFLGDPSRVIAAGWGIGINWVLIIWAAIVALLYPLAKWYAGIKLQKRRWWLSYL